MRVRGLEVSYVIIPLMDYLDISNIQNERQKKKEYLPPDLEGAPSREQLMDRGLVPLDYFDGLPDLFQRIAIKTGIPLSDFNRIKERLFVNPLLPLFQPHQLGGFHTKDKYIQFNPVILKDPNAEKLIAHVFFHEYQHMIGFYDESIVEMMTIAKMEEVYGEAGVATGYVQLVNELKRLIGDRSYEDLYELMTQSNAESIDVILSEMIIRSTFDSYFPGLLESMKVTNLMQSAKSKWLYMLKLFPRLINSKKGLGMFDEATMSWFEVNQMNIQDAIAERVLRDPVIGQRFVNILINRGEEALRDFIQDPEYQYLFEYFERNNLSLAAYLLSNYKQAEGQIEQ